jgi:hypothetical protein
MGSNRPGVRKCRVKEVPDGLTRVTGSTDGAGNVVLNADGSGPNGLGLGLGSQSPYNIGSSGGGPTPDGSIIYLVSSTEFRLLENNQHAKVDVYEH